MASASSFALTLYVPNLYIDWGVNPKCPITGIPAVKILSTDSITSDPPSNFTACASDSFIILIADRRAFFESPWYDPNGKSMTTNDLLAALTTEDAWYIMHLQ